MLRPQWLLSEPMLKSGSHKSYANFLTQKYFCTTSVLFGNKATKPFIGRSKTSQIFKSYVYSHSLKQMFLSQENAKAETSQGG